MSNDNLEDDLDIFEDAIETKPKAPVNKKDTSKEANKDKKDLQQKELPEVDTIQDSDLSLKERKSKVSSTVNGVTYTFPYNEVANINISIALARTFIPENLKIGQVFTMNTTMNTFLIMPEIGCTLSTDKPHFTYTQEFSGFQLDRLLNAVRTGALLIGKIKITKPELQVANSVIDCKNLLDRPLKVFKEDLRDIISRQTFIKDDGTIVSPALDLKALLKYENDNKNRRDYVSLIRTAMNKIQGSVEYLDKMTEVRPIGKDDGGKSTPAKTTQNSHRAL